MLHLTDKIGEGWEREIYRHPDDPARVVKIGRRDRPYDRNRIELAYRSRLDGTDASFIARLYSIVETDRGPGLVCEYVADADTRPSRTLLDHLADEDADLADIQAKLQAFFDWADREAICLYDVNMSNFLIQKLPDGGSRLVMIDGFGPRFMNIRWRLRMTSSHLIRLRVKKSRRVMQAQWRRQIEAAGARPPG